MSHRRPGLSDAAPVGEEVGPLRPDGLEIARVSQRRSGGVSAIGGGFQLLAAYPPSLEAQGRVLTARGLHHPHAAALALGRRLDFDIVRAVG